MHIESDVVVVGGGMIGLSISKALVNLNYKVAIIEKNTPPLVWDQSEVADRVSAINRRTQVFLQSIGVWDNIIANIGSGCAYTNMDICTNHTKETLHLSSHEVGETELGFIIENRLVIREVWNSLKSSNTSIHISDISDISGNPGNWKINLSSREIIRCKLIVGCDGANSMIRKYFNFNLFEKSYGHYAMIATVKVDNANQDTAYQKFSDTNIIAFLPTNKKSIFSMVWSMNEYDFERNMNLTNLDFDRELNAVIMDRLGKCQVLSERKGYPLIERHVKQYSKHGVVLVGDSAHTFHPLAGQGVNVGFNDVIKFIKTISKLRDRGRLVWHESSLREYEREVRLYNSTVIILIKSLKQLFSTKKNSVIRARGFGVKIFNKFTIIKGIIIKLAMGKIK